MNRGRCLVDSNSASGFSCQCLDWFTGDLCDQSKFFIQSYDADYDHEGIYFIYLFLSCFFLLVDQTPNKVTVEILAIVDKTAIIKHQKFLKTTDDKIVIPHMRVYFSNMFNEVIINFIFTNLI
jgi:hypothetical protein